MTVSLLTIKGMESSSGGLLLNTEANKAFRTSTSEGWRKKHQENIPSQVTPRTT